MEITLALSTLSDKIEYIKQNRAENYRQSLRLEGVNVEKPLQTLPLSKQELIAKYKALAN